MNRGGTNSCWKSQFKISLVRNEYMVVRGGTPPRIWWMHLKYLFQQLEYLPGNSIDWDVPHEHARRKETKKHLRKSCYHRIKCTTATFLAAFMWRKPLNSAASVTTAHRKPEKLSNGTSTQIRAQMINKCRMKMIQRESYNMRDPPWEMDHKNREREYCSNLNYLYTKLWSIYRSLTSLD